MQPSERLNKFLSTMNYMSYLQKIEQQVLLLKQQKKRTRGGRVQVLVVGNLLKKLIACYLKTP